MDDQRPEGQEYECVLGFETRYPISQDAAQELWRQAEHFGSVGRCQYERRTRGTAVAASPIMIIQGAMREVTGVLNAHDLLPRYTKITCEELSN